MPAVPTVLKIVLAALVVAAPASVTIAAVSDGDALSFLSSNANDGGVEGTILHEEGGEFDVLPEKGDLDLRIDQGAVRVIGWDQDAWHLQVIQAPEAAREFGESNTKIKVKDTSSEDVFELAVRVAHSTPLMDLTVDEDEGTWVGSNKPTTAILLYVPSAIAYESVHLCAFSQGFGHFQFSQKGLGLENDAECMPRAEASGPLGLTTDGSEHAGLDIASGAEGISGSRFCVLTAYGDVDLAELDFDEGHAGASYGDLVGREVNFGTGHFMSKYGDLTLDGDFKSLMAHTAYGDLGLTGAAAELMAESGYGDLAVEGDFGDVKAFTRNGDVNFLGSFVNAMFHTRYGDVLLDLTQVNTGEAVVHSEYGDVQTLLPAASGAGYDLEVMTEYGAIEIAVADVVVEGHSEKMSSDDSDDPDEPREPLTPWDWDSEDEPGDHVVAKSADYEERAVQFALHGMTRYGDVTISDGSEVVYDNSADHEHEDDDHDDHDDDEPHAHKDVLGVA